MRRNERGISLIVLVIAIVLMAVLVAVGVVLIVNKDNTEIDNKKSKTEEQYEDLEKFYISKGINIYYDEKIWKEEKDSDLGQTYKLLIHKDTDLTLGFQTYEDFSDEYDFSNEKGREEFYEYLTEGTDDSDNSTKNEKFELLNGEFYYIFNEYFNSLFNVYERNYVVIDTKTDIAYIFLVASDEFTQEQEKDILELLKTMG